jgi:ribose transport system substrate-binding protein
MAQHAWIVLILLAATSVMAGESVQTSSSTTSGKPGKPGKPRVALVMKSLANEFFQMMQDGARAHQRAHAGDYELLATGIKDEIDTAGQIRLVDQMLARRIDVLIIAPSDSKALVPAVQAAIARGVIVVNIDNRLDAAALAEKSIRVPFVGPDNRAGARLAGEYLARQLGPGDKVGIIEGVPTTVNAQQRTAGFRDAMAAKGVRVVAVQSGEWDLAKSNIVAAAMLREHPDLAAFLCGNDTMALGAVAAVRSIGKAGKVKIVGYDNIPAMQPLLHDGRVLATVDQFASEQAVAAIEIALKAWVSKTPQHALPALANSRIALITR